MHFIVRIIIQTAGNAGIIFGLNRFLPGFVFSGSVIQLITDALILTALNNTLRPILRIVLSPIVFITIGLFSIIINAAMIYLLDIISNHLIIQDNISLLISAALVGLVNLIAAKK